MSENAIPHSTKERNRTWALRVLPIVLVVAFLNALLNWYWERLDLQKLADEKAKAAEVAKLRGTQNLTRVHVEHSLLTYKSTFLQQCFEDSHALANRMHSENWKYYASKITLQRLNIDFMRTHIPRYSSHNVLPYNQFDFHSQAFSEFEPGPQMVVPCLAGFSALGAYRNLPDSLPDASEIDICLFCSLYDKHVEKMQYRYSPPYETYFIPGSEPKPVPPYIVNAEVNSDVRIKVELPQPQLSYEVVLTHLKIDSYSPTGDYYSLHLPLFDLFPRSGFFATAEEFREHQSAAIQRGRAYLKNSPKEPKINKRNSSYRSEKEYCYRFPEYISEHEEFLLLPEALNHLEKKAQILDAHYESIFQALKDGIPFKERLIQLHPAPQN